MTRISLTTGELETNDNLDGWVITSDKASFVPPGVPEYLADDPGVSVQMVKGDRIDINGNVRRPGSTHIIANIAI